jgi:hypothetical protein
MPSAAFNSWIDEVATDRIILCDLQMAEQTAGDGWTSEAPTYANSHSITWSNFIGTGGDAVYRRIDKVRENETDYTERASAALVDANASSWYYDEANTKLYVRTSTGSDPDTFSSIAVYFSIFAGTTVKAFAGGQLYEPMLVGELPVINLQAEDILFGIKILEEGNIDFQNANAFWDTVSQDYIWKNKLVTLYIGGGTLDFDDYEKVAVMRIEDAAVGDDICRFRLKHMATILDKILPLNTFTEASYPKAGEGVVGTYKPMIYGAITDAPGVLIDTTSGANVWMLHDGDGTFALTAISNVRMVDINGVRNGLTVTTHYTVDLAAGTVTVTDTDYDHENYSLIADVTGDTDGAGGYLDTWAEQWQDIMLLLGEDSANIDASSFSTADSDGFQKTALYMREPKKASEYLMLLERSVRGSIYINREGQWAATVHLPYGMKDETADSLGDEDFVTWEPEDKIETVYHEVRVKYGFNPSTGSWKEKTASNSQVEYELERSDTATIETALINGSEASRQAGRYLLTLEQPSIQVAMQQRGLGGLLKHPFERYIITRSRAPDSAGSWTDEPVELIEVQKTLAPPGVYLRIRKLGLGSRGTRIHYWATSGILDYDSEDATDQDTYAFWHDSNGQVGAGNVENHSSWY